MTDVKQLLGLFERDAGDAENSGSAFKETVGSMGFKQQRQFNNLGKRLHAVQLALEQEKRYLASSGKKKILRKSWSMPATTLVKNANQKEHDLKYNFNVHIGPATNTDWKFRDNCWKQSLIDPIAGSPHRSVVIGKKGSARDIKYCLREPFFSHGVRHGRATKPRKRVSKLPIVIPGVTPIEKKNSPSKRSLQISPIRRMRETSLPNIIVGVPSILAKAYEDLKKEAAIGRKILKGDIPLLQHLAEYTYKDYDKPKIEFKGFSGKYELDCLKKGEMDAVSTLSPPPGPRRIEQEESFPDPEAWKWNMNRTYSEPVKHRHDPNFFLPHSPPKYRQFVNGEYHPILTREPLFQNWRGAEKAGAAAR